MATKGLSHARSQTHLGVAVEPQLLLRGRSAECEFGQLVGAAGWRCCRRRGFDRLLAACAAVSLGTCSSGSTDLHDR